MNVDALIARYGYFAIFALLMLGIVGPLIPDETILVVAGIFARQGRLEYLWVLAAGYAGSLCGITMSYFVGRLGLVYLLKKVPFLRKHADESMKKVEGFYARFGGWTLFFGYYIAGIRHFTAVFAGAGSMDMRKFALFAYLGAICWVIAFVSLGYFLGDQWDHIHELLRHGGVAAGIVVAICALAWWWRRSTITRG